MKQIFLLVLIFLLQQNITAETTLSKSGPQDNDWPVDCPNCQPFRNGQKQNNTGGKLLSDAEIIDHVNALLPYFPKNFINPKIAVCIARKESKKYSAAANGKSTARGLYQVLKGTAAVALKETPCKGVTTYNWSTMAASSRAQTFVFLCVAYMKTREAGRSSFDSVGVKRYHGDNRDSVNRAYLKSVRRNGCSGIL